MAYYVSPGKEAGWIYGTFQQAYPDANGVLKWQKVYKAGDAQSARNVKNLIHVSNMYIHCYMDDQKIAEKDALKKKLHNEKKAIQQTRRDKAQGGSKFEGPFGEKESFTGKITINIGQDGQSVQGTFKATSKVHKKGHNEFKLEMDGEFLGAINPDTGQMEAKISDGKLWTFIKREGNWWPTVMPRSMVNAKVVGLRKGDALSGHFEMGSNKGFAWTAKPAVEKDTKEKKQ